MIFSCDVNAANIFFLQSQNKILEKESEGVIYRYYKGTGKNRDGWLFPSQLFLDSDPEAVEELKPYLQSLLKIDSNPNFILLTEEQRTVLEKCVAENFPHLKISFDSDEGDSDYIYTVEKMAVLPGKDFQKKRNHVSRFLRTYGEDWKFEFYDGETKLSRPEDLMKIYLQWKQEQMQNENDFLVSEEKSFGLAVDSDIFERLGLIAGVLYVNKEPSAFLIASFTGAECLNVHFEKCIEKVSANGGLSVLNQQFAKSIQEKFPQCKYLNREEDLNIPGLRKSKLSYKPEFLIKKYFGRLEV